MNDSVVTVHPLPQVDFTAPDVCAYLPLDITDASIITSGSITDWEWDVEGQGTILTQAVGPFQNGPDSIDVTLTTTSDRACVSSLTRTMVVHPVPEAAFSALDVCQYDEVQYCRWVHDHSGTQG